MGVVVVVWVVVVVVSSKARGEPDSRETWRRLDYFQPSPGWPNSSRTP
jgi:hypothetical protein